MCDSTSLPSPETYRSPGGFVWWYLDLRDKEGNGLVLIWAFGLPFLPNYASAARQGVAPMPIERPSINISIYTKGKLDFYLLQEYAQEDCDATPHHWRFDQTTIHFTQDSGIGHLSINLNCPVPNSEHRLLGTINFSGPLRYGLLGKPDPTHQWTPIIVAAKGTAKLSCGNNKYHISGRGYHDRNAGTHPLHDLDIDIWWWGRLAFPEYEIIFYTLYSKSDPDPLFLTLKIDQTGQTEHLKNAHIELSQYKKSFYGLRWADQIHLNWPDLSTIHVQMRHKIEDGPFYQRFMCDASTEDGTVEAYGFVEQIVPDKVDSDWMRPLVKMRVHTVSKSNSMWLPLFTGPKKDRIKRLFRWGSS